LEVGKGVAWEGNLLYNMLYDAKLVSEKIVLVTLDGLLSELPLVLKGRHVHPWASGQVALVQTLKGQRAPIPPLGGADSTPPSDPPPSPSAKAVEFAMKLLDEVLSDAAILAVVRRALGLAEAMPKVGVLQAIRDGDAEELARALSEAHRVAAGQAGGATGLDLERAIMLLLPFIGDWAQFIEDTHQARANANGAVRLRINDIRVAELIVAGADQRGVRFRTIRVRDADQIEPVLLMPLSRTIDAYRAGREEIRSVTERQFALQGGGPFAYAAERIAQVRGLTDDLAGLSQAYGQPLDQYGLMDIQDALKAERRADPSERRTWAVVVQGGEDQATDEVWEVVTEAMASLPSLRLVRLYGSRADRVQGASAAFVHILNIVKRKENT
jgi:hypothetical protein